MTIHKGPWPIYPRRSDADAYRPVGDAGGLVVLPIRSEVKVLNPVGSKIYSLLDGKHSRSEIVRAVVEEFDVTEEQATQDLDDFLEDLDAAGMLAMPEDPDAPKSKERDE